MPEFEEYTRYGTITTRAKKDGKMREAVIAVNDDVGDGWPIPLRQVNLSRYMKNPVVFLNHDRFRGLPIGKTERVNFNDDGQMVAEFFFAEDDELADRVRNLWDQEILRAASITVRFWWDWETDEERYYLIEWSIVGVPADEDAVTKGLPAEGDAGARSRMITRELRREREDPSMTEPNWDQKVEQAVRRYMESQRSDQNSNLDISRTVTGVMEVVRGEIAGLVKERDDALEAQKSAEATVGERDQTIETLTGERDAAKAARTEEEQRAIDDQANERAEVLTRFGHLLPDDFERSGKTIHEVMIAAAGDAIEGAPDMHPERLRALLDVEVDRRQDDPTRRRTLPGDNNPSPRG